MPTPEGPRKETYRLLVSDTLQSGRILLMFLRTFLSPSTGNIWEKRGSTFLRTLYIIRNYVTLDCAGSVGNRRTRTNRPNSGKETRFFPLPKLRDCLWDQLNLLFNGCLGIFPVAKAAGTGTLPTSFRPLSRLHCMDLYLRSRVSIYSVGNNLNDTTSHPIQRKPLQPSLLET